MTRARTRGAQTFMSLDDADPPGRLLPASAQRHRFEPIFTTPVEWIAERLVQLPRATPRRGVVLVANERQAHAVRRDLCVERGCAGALAGIVFLRPGEFARELLIRAGVVRRPGWEEVRRLRILQQLESEALEGQLRYFSPAQLRSGHGYVDAFARTIADLEAAGLTVASALSISARLAPTNRAASDRLHDVVRLWEAAEADATVRVTTARMLSDAAALLVSRPEMLEPWGPTFALLTASPSTALLRFLRAIPECRVVFQDARPWRKDVQRWRPLIELERNGSGDRTGAAGAMQAESSELALAKRYLFELPETLTDPDRARSRGPDGSVDLEEYASIEDEIEAAATWVTEQIAAGIPVESIALIVPEIDPYAGLLADRLARVVTSSEDYPLRAAIAGGLSWAATPAGTRLLGLISALSRGLEAEATIRVLPWLRRGQDSNSEGRERLSPSRAAEIVYGAGIVGGSPGDHSALGEWTTRVTRRREALRRFVDRAVPSPAVDGPEKRMDVRTRHDAERWLRDVEPIVPALTALQTLADVVLTGRPLGIVWARVRAFCERWLRVPLHPPNLLASIGQSIEPILADPVAAVIVGTDALQLLAYVLHHERRPVVRFGEPAVFVGTAGHAAGLPFAAVRVLGLAEGALPHTPHDDPILPDELRRRIEEQARQIEPDVVLPRLADHVLDDIHDFFRVVSATRTRLALSAPRQWVDRSEREVSGIMLEMATALGRTPNAGDEGDVPSAAHLRASYLDRGRAARQSAARAFPLSPRTLVSLTRNETGGTLAVPSAWTRGAALAIDRLSRIAVLDGSATGGLNGMIGDARLMLPTPGLVPQRPISATALIALLGCPFRFFLERLLYLKAPVARPSTDGITPVAYGSLFHAAAERFFSEAGPAICRREGQVTDWMAHAREIASAEFDAVRETLPLRGADGVARERERLLRQIEQLVQYEWQMPAREFLDSEWVFGDPQAVCLQLESGDLYVRGAIDRVDRMSPAALSVRDLKTGRVRDLREDPLNAARDLQIGLYVLVLEATGHGGAPVGMAAYVHPSTAQEPDRAFADDEVDLLRRHTRDWLSMARRLLADGTFPRTPNAEDCAYCPFVAACGDGAQQRSAAALDRLPAEHALQDFVRFKRKPVEEE